MPVVRMAENTRLAMRPAVLSVVLFHQLEQLLRYPAAQMAPASVPGMRGIDRNVTKCLLFLLDLLLD